MRRLLPALSTLTLLGLGACPEPPPQPPPDGGPEEDAGELPDASLPDAGAEDGGSADAGFGPVPIESWCRSRALAQCAREVRCLLLEPGRMEECLARQLEGCDQLAYQSGVDGGRLQYSPSHGADCLNGYAGSGCGGVPDSCQGLFAGLVPPDGGCLLPEECTPDGFCSLYSNSCPFSCVSYLPLGASCNGWDQRCHPREATCQQDGGYRFCATPKEVGEECGWDSCREGLVCYQGKCLQGQAALGEPCQLDGPYPACASEEFCRLGTKLPDGGQPGLCQKRVGLGGVCWGWGSCLPNLRCSRSYQTGVCEPLGSEGEACTYSDCKRELFCSSQTSRCAPLPGAGGDCTSTGSFASCAGGYYCDFTAPDQEYRCAPRKARGEKCSYDAQCLSNTCDSGRLADGGPGLVCTAPCSERVDGGL